jgi:hypothetical protein
MTDPSTWPLFPLLPLLRTGEPRDEGGDAYTIKELQVLEEHMGQFGLLVATNGPTSPPPPIVYRRLVSDVPPLDVPLSALPQVRYASFGSLIAAGWVID